MNSQCCASLLAWRLCCRNSWASPPLRIACDRVREHALDSGHRHILYEQEYGIHLPLALGPSQNSILLPSRNMRKHEISCDLMDLIEHTNPKQQPRPNILNRMLWSDEPQLMRKGNPHSHQLNRRKRSLATCDRSGMGFGTEPEGNSFKGIIPSFPTEHQQNNQHLASRAALASDRLVVGESSHSATGKGPGQNLRVAPVLPLSHRNQVKKKTDTYDTETKSRKGKPKSGDVWQPVSQRFAWVRGQSRFRASPATARGFPW